MSPLSFAAAFFAGRGSAPRAAVWLGALSVLTGCVDWDLLDRVNKQSVMIETPHVTNATCSLTDRAGRQVLLNRTPEPALVPVGRPPLTAMCWKDGYVKTYVKIDEEFVPAADRFPHLLEEMTGFVKDPFKLFGSRYPDEIRVMLPPVKWTSEKERAAWEAEKAAYESERLKRREEREARARAMEELELMLRYRKEHDSVRDPSRQSLPILTETGRAVRYFGGDAMIPELVREKDDLDPALTNRSAEEIIDQFLAYKKRQLLTERQGREGGENASRAR